MIEHALRSILAADEDVIGLVEDRIYYLVASQNVTAPYIVISRVSSSSDHTHDGPSGLLGAHIQFSVFAGTYLAVSQITAAIRSCLDGFTGESEGVQIEKCLYINEVDMYENQTGLQFKPSDYDIYYKEE